VTCRVLMVVAMALYTGSACADERVVALVNSFQVFCTLEVPDFAALDAKATAMKLSVLDDLGTPRRDGFFVHSKSWLMPLTTGTLAVGAAESRGPKGEVVGCSIYAPDARGDEVKRELMRAMDIGDPFNENVADDGQRVTVWRTKMGSDDVTVMLAGPADAPGFHLTLMQELPARR
jgi:hypothetical protein